MIEIGKYAGFCGGVMNSVNQTQKKLNKSEELYCLGELVHNKQVISYLEKQGLIIIDSLDKVKGNSKVIIRAHGVPQNIYLEAQKRNIKLIDLTCPKVLKIHNEVEKYRENDYFIILVGSKLHPEVIGTLSFCGNKSIVIEDKNDLNEVIDLIDKRNYKKIAIFAQNTYKESLFNEIVNTLKDKLKDKIIEVKNTICNATHQRQEECKKMAQSKDCMIIIGGKNSSNTKKLCEISKEFCKNTYLIETVEELNINNIKAFNNIGIMAGASTPKSSIQDVLDKLS